MEFRKNWKKDEKVGYVFTMFGVEVPSTVSTKPSQSRTRTKPKNPLPLKHLVSVCFRPRPTQRLICVLVILHIYLKKKLRERQNESPFSCPAKFEGICEDIKYWFSYPKKSTMTGSLLTKSIDCSHNLTYKYKRHMWCFISSMEQVR